LRSYVGMYKHVPYRVAKITMLEGSLHFELFERHARSGLLALTPMSGTDFINEEQ